MLYFISIYVYILHRCDYYITIVAYTGRVVVYGVLPLSNYLNLRGLDLYCMLGKIVSLLRRGVAQIG